MKTGGQLAAGAEEEITPERWWRVCIVSRIAPTVIWRDIDAVFFPCSLGQASSG